MHVFLLISSSLCIKNIAPNEINNAKATKARSDQAGRTTKNMIPREINMIVVATTVNTDVNCTKQLIDTQKGQNMWISKTKIYWLTI